MPDHDNINHQLRLLSIARGNVRHLMTQVQSHGGFSNTPLKVVNDLEENWNSISSIKATLRGWGVQVEDLPNDERPHPKRSAPQSTPPAAARPPYLSLTWWVSIATLAALVVAVGAWLWPDPLKNGDSATSRPPDGTATPAFIAETTGPDVIAPGPTPTPIASARVSLVHTLAGQEGAIWGARLNPEDATAFTSGEDGLIRRWNTRSGMEIGQYGSDNAGEAKMGGLAVSPDGTLVAGAYARGGNDRFGEGFIQLFQVADGELIHTFIGHTAYVWTVDFSPDGKHLASAGADGTIRLWNVASGAEEGVLRGHTTLVTAVAFSPDGTRLASVSYDGSLRIWDVASGKQQAKAAADNTFAVAWTPDGAFVVSSNGDQEILIINAGDGSLARSIKTPNNPITLAVSPNGQLIAGGCNPSTICLWDFQTGAQLAEFGKNSPNVIAWNADGTQLIEGGNNKQARIWSIEY